MLLNASSRLQAPYMDVIQTLEKLRTLTDVRKMLKERYMSVKNARRTLKNVGDTLDRGSMDVTRALRKRSPSARHALDTRP